MAGVLYVVGTPIGNRADLSPRAVETLAVVDLVAAEDTRRTGRLLQASEVTAKLLSLFDGNERERTAEIVRRLRDGASVALVSDGGMPLVSDPGFRLVRACIADGIEVRVVPGPSAAIAALIVSGLPIDRFAFEGFLPRKPGERARRLDSLRHDGRTTVFFESPLRVHTLLRDLLDAFGDRRAALCRELTKLHEDVVRGRISELLAALEGDDVKGEVAVVVEGEPETAGDLDTSVAEARELVSAGMRKRDAARAVAERRRVPANDVYRALVGDR